MPGNSPATANIHVDKLLTNMSVMQLSEGYIADDAVSVVPTAKERDLYVTYNLDHARVHQTERGIGSEYTRLGWDVSQTTFVGVEYGHETMIDDRQRDLADSPINMDQSASKFLMEKLMLDREFRFGITLTTAGNYAAGTTNTSTPNPKWDAASATVVADIQAARAVVRQSFRGANQFTTSAEVALEMAAATDVRALSQYVRDMAKDIEIPNPFLGLKVVIGYARYVNTQQGPAVTDAATAVWPLSAIVHFVNPSMGLQDVTHYAAFRKQEMETRRYREEWKSTDVLRVNTIEALSRVVDGCGYLLTAVTTAFALSFFQASTGIFG